MPPETTRISPVTGETLRSARGGASLSGHRSGTRHGVRVVDVRGTNYGADVSVGWSTRMSYCEAQTITVHSGGQVYESVARDSWLIDGGTTVISTPGQRVHIDSTITKARLSKNGMLHVDFEHEESARKKGVLSVPAYSTALTALAIAPQALAAVSLAQEWARLSSLPADHDLHVALDNVRAMDMLAQRHVAGKQFDDRVVLAILRMCPN